MNAGKNDRVPNREHHWIDRDRERGRERKRSDGEPKREQKRALQKSKRTLDKEHTDTFRVNSLNLYFCLSLNIKKVLKDRRMANKTTSYLKLFPSSCY